MCILLCVVLESKANAAQGTSVACKTEQYLKPQNLNVIVFFYFSRVQNIKHKTKEVYIVVQNVRFSTIKSIMLHLFDRLLKKYRFWFRVSFFHLMLL